MNVCGAKELRPKAIGLLIFVSPAPNRDADDVV